MGFCQVDARAIQAHHFHANDCVLFGTAGSHHFSGVWTGTF
jgi:hypothetical protein